MFAAYQALCESRIEDQKKQLQSTWIPEKCRTTIQCNDATHFVLPLDEKLVATSHSTLGVIQVWDTKTNELLRSFGKVSHSHLTGWAYMYPPQDEMTWLWAMAKVGQDQLICSSYEVGAMKLFNWRTGQLVNTIRHEDPISGMGHDNLLSFENYVMAGLEDRTVTIWDVSVDGGRVEQVLEGHTGWVYCIETAAQGRLITGAGDNSIRFWNLSDGTCYHAIENCGHGGVLSLLHIHDNDMLISAGIDDTIRIWDMKQLECISTLYGHENRVRQVKLLGNDRIISVSDDHTIKVWDMRTGSCISTLKGHESPISTIAISENEVITGSEDKTIKIWT